MKNSPKLRKIVNADINTCIIQLQPYYPSCNTLIGCEACVSSRNCGWEIKEGICIPGSPSGPSCPIVGAIWK